MSVSPQLLALMSVTPTRSNGVTSWSILMDFRYPFAWETVSSFVLRQKAKGPPDDMVTLEVERNMFEYTVRMPWYARLVLGKTITWRDVLVADTDAKVLSEDGINTNLQRLGTVRDVSTWRACANDPHVTIYNKRVDFNIRMPLGPTIMMQVAQPLMRWFRTKSQLCREMEVQIIRDFLESEKDETEKESQARRDEDALWMAVLTTDKTPPLTPAAENSDEVLSASSPSKPTRIAAAKAKAQDVAAKAKAAGASAAERSRSRADESSVTRV